MEEAYISLSQAAEELGDIPDRFMCPIGCDIMRDPVTLPTSGQVRNRLAVLGGSTGMLVYVRSCSFVFFFFFFSRYGTIVSCCLMSSWWKIIWPMKEFTVTTNVLLCVSSRVRSKFFYSEPPLKDWRSFGQSLRTSLCIVFFSLDTFILCRKWIRRDWPMGMGI